MSLATSATFARRATRPAWNAALDGGEGEAPGLTRHGVQTTTVEGGQRDTTTKKQATETSDYPAWWDWDNPDDGDEVTGTFVSIGRGHTAMGGTAFATIEVDGKPRTFWLHWEALRSQFVREVARRPDKTIHAGERVIARHSGNRTSAKNGYEYHDFRVEFPGARGRRLRPTFSA